MTRALTSDDKALIEKLKKLDAGAKKAPWHQGGQKFKDGKIVYRLGEAEEALIIALRNHIGDLIRIIESK